MAFNGSMKIQSHRKVILHLFLYSLGALVLGPLAAQSPPATRTWQIKIAGEPSGTFTETTTAAREGNVATAEAMHLEMNRLGSKVEMKNESQSFENAQGELQSLKSSTSSSQTSTQTSVQVLGDHLALTTTAGDKTYRKSIPLTGSILGPKGVERLSRENLRKEGDTISFQMFSPELGNIAEVKRKVVGQERAGARDLFKVEEATAGFPGQATVLLDSQGRWLRRVQTLPFGEMVIEPLEEKSAPAPAPAAAATPSESYDQTLARSNVRLPDPRALKSVTLRLRHKKPELGWPVLENSSQHVLEKSDTLRVVEIHQSAAPSASDPKKSPAPGEEFLRPNAIVQSDDAEVMRIAAEVIKGAPNDFDKARRLQDWVNKNLTLDLGVVLAPASEVARNKRGTCIAYATLLAALERAAGLPSRIAMGYVYVDGIWGGHAWSEVFTDGRWIALDAALYAPGPADAARLWFGASSGDDQLMKLLVAAGQMYGSVSFEVVAFSTDHNSVKVPENAPPYRVTGNRYTNPWLGFSLDAPQKFRFTKMDAVYPDGTIVALEGPDDSRAAVELDNLRADENKAMKKRVNSSLGEAELVSRKFGQLDGQFARNAGGALFLWQKGSSVWSLTTKGPGAEALLEKILRSWKWSHES